MSMSLRGGGLSLRGISSIAPCGRRRLAPLAAAGGWLAVALLLCLPLTAHAQAGGVVQGQVINGTAGTAPKLAGLQVRLYLFSGNTLKETRKADSNAQGAFRFDTVPTGSAWTAITSVEYAGVEYEGKPLDLTNGTDFSSDVTIYETTTEDQALKVDRSHLIIEMGVGQLEVTELVVLNNTGDRTYVGSQEVVPNRRATARVALPTGASDVSFSSEDVGGAMVRTGEGFVDTRPIIPGTQQYVLSYALPAEGSTYNLTKPIAYPTAAIDVLVDAPGAEVNAPSLNRLGVRQAEGRDYQHLGGQSLQKGADLTIRFTGLGQPSSAQTSRQGSSGSVGTAQTPWWLNLVPLVALVALAPIVVLRLRRQDSEPWPLPRRQTATAIQSERDRLLAAITELDERYEAGQLDEGAYRKQRQAVKDELINLMLSPQSRESDAKGDRDARATRGARDDRSRKEIRTRGGAAQRRPKA